MLIDRLVNFERKRVVLLVPKSGREPVWERNIRRYMPGGYAILDKHVLSSLAELGIIESPRPPSTRARYLETEHRMKQFALGLRIDFDELDLVLWSMKTGEILK